MYIPAHFRDDDPRALVVASPLATLVTPTADGLVANPVPLLLVPDEGEYGVLYGHVSRANEQWRCVPTGESLAIFVGDNAYITPSWYATKRETGKVVPTWNYLTVHAHGALEILDDVERVREIVTRLTTHHEAPRAQPWAVTDAPDDFISLQLRGIVGLRLVITRIEGKRKWSQNRSEADRAGVLAGLAENA
ncbi:MAG TPA: FMN-binding negative transcriptional regulator [Kofleriaceae bacterium]